MDKYKNINLNKLSIKSVLGKMHNSKILYEYKKTLSKISKEQWKILIGLIFGDASLHRKNKGKIYRLKFKWKDKNRDYAEYVHTLYNVYGS